MPHGDDDSASTFGDEEFMRQNNLSIDEIPETPYWEQELIARKEIKVSGGYIGVWRIVYIMFYS